MLCTLAHAGAASARRRRDGDGEAAAASPAPAPADRAWRSFTFVTNNPSDRAALEAAIAWRLARFAAPHLEPSAHVTMVPLDSMAPRQVGSRVM